MGIFKIKKITKLGAKNAKVGQEIPESDYSLITKDDRFIQFEYKRDEDNIEPLSIKPGIWAIAKSMAGYSLIPTKFTDKAILEEYVTTQEVNGKIDKFFERAHIYKQYGRDPKRGFLFYSTPGLGKSCAIASVCKKQVEKRKVAVVIWHTDKFEASEVSSFVKAFDYEKHGVAQFILVTEDIGGTEMEGARMRSDSSLLSLLDNTEQTFKVPTVILATTNYINSFMENLTNRPGRFDDKIEIKPPSPEARVKFLEFFSNNEADENGKLEVRDKSYDGLSVAHIEEAFIRSKIYDISLVESLKQIKKEIAKYKASFTDKQGGIGMGNYE